MYFFRRKEESLSQDYEFMKHKHETTNTFCKNCFIILIKMFLGKHVYAKLSRKFFYCQSLFITSLVPLQT